jgi:branched-chain amino acid transport system permease protein
MSGYVGGVLVILCINVILAYAVFLPVAAGQLNLGGAAFQAVGAYTAGYLATNYEALPISLVFVAACIASGLIAFFFSLSILRTKSVYLVLATFAFAEFVSGVIVNVPALGGSMGLPVPPHLGSTVVFAAAAVTTVIVLLLMQTRFGLAMRAIHDDDAVAELMGIGVRRTRVAAFTVGGMLAGIAGCLYAFYFNFVDISNFSADSSIYLLLFVLLGGTQTIWGPLVGAAFFTIVPELFRSAAAALPALAHMFGFSGQFDTSWRFVFLGVATVIMMVVRHEGVVTRIGLGRIFSRVPASAERRSQHA